MELELENAESNAASLVEFIEGELGLTTQEAIPALVKAIGNYARALESSDDADALLDSAANLLADEEI